MHRLLTFALSLYLVASLPQAYSQSVYISEFMASNLDSLDDEDGDSPDWIELFNPGDSPVDLDGWYLSDDPAQLTKWPIPGITLGGGQFVVIFASDKNRRDPAGELHTNFKLSAGGDYLALVRPDGVTVEHGYAPSYPAQITDVSYGIGMSGGTSILVDHGDPLRYKIPTGGGDDVEDGLNPNPWIGPGFDDAPWAAGSLGIGYARAEPDAYDPYILTDLESQMDGIHPSAYVRVEFEVADPSADRRASTCACATMTALSLTSTASPSRWLRRMPQPHPSSTGSPARPPPRTIPRRSSSRTFSSPIRRCCPGRTCWRSMP